MKSRKCPTCKNILTYKTERTYNSAIKKKTKCRSCNNKIMWNVSREDKIKKLLKPRILKICKCVKCGKKFKQIIVINSTKYKPKKCCSIKCAQDRTGSKRTIEQRNNSSVSRIKALEKKWGISYDEYLKNLPANIEYRKAVNKITRKQPLNSLKNYSKRGPLKYHIDHIIPINVGFLKNISPEIIGNIKNLKMMWWKDNIIKSNKISEKKLNETLKLIEFNMPIDVRNQFFKK